LKGATEEGAEAAADDATEELGITGTLGLANRPEEADEAVG
jgi:hypothetical protein